MEPHRRIKFRKPSAQDALAKPVVVEGTDFDYTKADADDGWIGFDDEGQIAHGDPQTVKLDTTNLP